MGLVWSGAWAGVTALLWWWRPHLDKAHMALAFLLLVLAGTARSGRAVGLVLAVSAFLSFDFFLLPPYYTLTLADPLDWGVLLSFLLAAGVAAELLARAQRAADLAELRSAEVEHFASLGAETLNAGRAEEAVGAIAQVIGSTLGIARCTIFGGTSGDLRCLGSFGEEQTARGAPAEGILRYVVEHMTTAAIHLDGTVAVGGGLTDGLARMAASGPAVRGVVLPLVVHDRAVGALGIDDDRAVNLDAGRRRFLEALGYYAALGVERIRLVAEAERVHALEEADRLKDALIAAVSHDLRTPLTSIKAFASELMMEGDERAEAIVQEADRLNRFVSDLLDLSRLNSGGLPLRPEYVPADDLLATAAQQTAGVLSGHELRLRLPPGEMLVGRFDPVHALRALTNLIENALKHSPRGAPVEVSVHRAGVDLVFDVEDHGPGVVPEERDRIFEPFYQIRAGPGTGGVGLGLSIARRIARAQGGTVRVSDRPGGGSRFSLSLPAANIPAEVLELG